MRLILGGIAVVVVIIGFNFWLDAGCGLSGYVTWHGKECLNK